MQCPRIFASLGLSWLLTSAACFANSTDFTGHWVLDAGASKVPYKISSSQTMDITQKDSTMEVLETTASARQKHIYKLDGSTQKESVEGVRTVEVCAKVQGSTLQLTTACGKSKTSQTWQLIDGGNTLKIDSTQSGLISRQQVLVYRKK